MLRRGPVTKTTEVDDATDSLAAGHLREGTRRPLLLFGKVAFAAAPHSVHQVVRDVDVATRSFQCLRLGAVPLGQLETLLDEPPGSPLVPNQAAHWVSVGCEPPCDATADETGCTCYQGVHGLARCERCPAAIGSPLRSSAPTSAAESSC